MAGDRGIEIIETALCMIAIPSEGQHDMHDVPSNRQGLGIASLHDMTQNR